MRETIEDMLKAAQQRGEIDSDLDLEAASRLVNGLTIVVGDSQLLPYLNHYFQITGETVPIGRIVEAMVDLIMNGFAPKHQTSSGGV